MHPCLECGFGLPMLSYYFWSPCEQALTRTSKWCTWYEPVPGSDSLAPELVLVSMHHPFGAFGGIFRFQIPEPPTGSGNPSSFWFPLAPHHRFVWWHICGHHFLVRIGTKIFNCVPGGVSSSWIIFISLIFSFFLTLRSSYRGCTYA